MPVIAGVVGYGGDFTKEQLQSDDSILNDVLKSLHRIISDGIPLSEHIDKEYMEVIMYLPDLIN